MAVILQTASSVRLTTGSGLDEIFDSGFEMDKQPGETRIDDTLFFRQDTTDWLAIQFAESMGPGNFTEVAEDEEPDEWCGFVPNATSASTASEVV